MSSHKTNQTLRLFEACRVPYIFSTPASFQCLPVESVFKYLKLSDFRDIPLPDDLKLSNISPESLNHKLRLLVLVSHFIVNITRQKMNIIFSERLKNLGAFLEKKRIWVFE